MKTYQDWLKYADKSEQERMDFVRSAINDHKGGKAYREAMAGEAYYAGENLTIKQFEKWLYNAKGERMPDYVSPNHRIATRFFYRDVTQANSVLLGNGIKWKKEGESVLGRDFDQRIIDAGLCAMVEGCSFGFFNVDHVEVFELREFVPLFDEEDGGLKAGIRFWQISDDKPLRATLYELDGYTEYLWEKGKASVMQEKRSYMLKKNISVADGEEIYDFQNYPSFPIVPCYANRLKISELLPIRSTLDAFDLINSSYSDDVESGNALFWTVSNAGGMDDVDLVNMMKKIRDLHAFTVDDQAQIQSHQIEAPYQGREAILDRLEKQLYKDAMALNTYDLANGAVTATQIQAAYEPLNEKLDEYEAQLITFIKRLLLIAGEENDATFDRSMVVNKTEEIQAVVQSAMYLDQEYVTEKLLSIFGDKDLTEEVKNKMNGENYSRFTGGKKAE